MSTGRSVAADLDPKEGWRGRKIYVTRFRDRADVELNRDNWVDYRREHDGLPEEYTTAVDRCREAGMKRLFVDGYTGGFSWGGGARFITLFVPHRFVTAAVAALRAAEMRADMTLLERLAERMDPPVDSWLAPGERALTVGADFACSPSQMLTFLRGEARLRGLRLNGRVDGLTVWVEPTRDVFESWSRRIETGDPDPYPATPNPRLRPVAPRRRRGDSGAERIRYVSVGGVGRPGDCPCGWGGREKHEREHMRWFDGYPIPSTLGYMPGVAVVESMSPKSWRKLAYECARLAKRDGGYDFASFDYPTDNPKPHKQGLRAYLLRADRRVVGYLSVRDIPGHGYYDFSPDRKVEFTDRTTRPQVNLIFVASRWRRHGVARRLVEALGADACVDVADLSWGLPFSAAGEALARSLSPTGVWVS